MATTFTPDNDLVTSTALSPNRTITNGRVVSWVVLHTMETQEHSQVAENIGYGWFTNPTAYASAHYNVDNDSIVQGVPEKDMAWAAPGANELGIQVEHAGRAGQSAAEWADAYSTAMLDRSARLVARICLDNGIPPVKLTDAQVAAGAKGIIDHSQASAVWRLSDHWDVGSNFPWDSYIAQVRAYYYGTGTTSAPSTTPTPTKDWFDMATRKDLEDVVFNTRRPEWGNRTLTEVVREVDSNSWSGLRMLKHLFNLYRVGIPGVITDGALGGAIRRLAGYDEEGQGKARKAEHAADIANNFRY